MNTAAAKPISTLMIVDDNDFDQRMYKRIVQRSSMIGSLIQYTNPREALDFLLDPEQEMPSLVLLDINMPQINGFDFLEVVSNELGNAVCPIIVMLTTSLNPADAERARTFYVVKDFLNKPLTRALLEHVADIVTRERRAA